MITEKIELLKRLTFNILKEMCFLFQSEDLSSVQSEELPILVRIDCGKKYSLFLHFDPILAHTIARNFLGTAQEVIESPFLESALTEVVNMVGGNFMNATHMESTAHLSLPEIVEEDWRVFGHDPRTRIVTEAIKVNDRPLQLTIAEHMA
ncbi:MAG TPA: chemotaxis protein CheX [bacterium]|nr:chemotaxis protein CheX [bacterium]